MAKLTVKVTKEDIAKGKPQDSMKCPVARAFQRCLKRGLSVSVGAELQVFKKNQVESVSVKLGHGIQYNPYLFCKKSPPKATNFMYKIDSSCDNVRPFSFTITGIDKSLLRK